MGKNNIFSKNYKYEEYINVFIGVIFFIVGILLVTKVIEFPVEEGESENKNFIIGIISIVAGVLLTVFYSLAIKKKRHLKKNSIYYVIMDDYKNDRIKNALIVLGLDEERIQFEEIGETLLIEYTCKNGCFLISVEETNVFICYDYNDDFLEEESNEIDEVLDEIMEEFDTTKVTKETIYNKFYSIIIENDHRANN